MKFMDRNWYIIEIVDFRNKIFELYLFHIQENTNIGRRFWFAQIKHAALISRPATKYKLRRSSSNAVGNLSAFSL